MNKITKFYTILLITAVTSHGFAYEVQNSFASVGRQLLINSNQNHALKLIDTEIGHFIRIAKMRDLSKVAKKDELLGSIQAARLFLSFSHTNSGNKLNTMIATTTTNVAFEALSRIEALVQADQFASAARILESVLR